MYIKNDLKQAKTNYFRTTLANGLIGIMIVLVVMGFSELPPLTQTALAWQTSVLSPMVIGMLI